MERESMKKKNILICDDSPEAGSIYKKRLERVDTVEEYFESPVLASKKELKEAIDALEMRLKQAKDDRIDDYPLDDPAFIVDDAAILVIDYALFDLDSSATGERLAYLARCYSKCGIIIALNQYPPYMEEQFDLTLRGHLESYADLNIPSDSISNLGMWTEPWDHFRPWSWPLLPQAVEKMARRVDEVQEHLDEKCLEFLGFIDARALTLPRSIIEFLSGVKPEEASFRDFVNSEGSGNGLRGRKERPINDEAIARIAAARIGCWLEYDILPGQDILVDAPHLVSRFPSLLGEGAQDVAAWTQTASFSEPAMIGLNPVIEPYRFTRSNWLSRPAWFWNDLRDNEIIEEVRNPFAILRLEQAFCEDISKFKPKDEVREFVADLNSPYSRRYVNYIEGKHYTPQVRFSL
jgi:hypothetical protein